MTRERRYVRVEMIRMFQGRVLTRLLRIDIILGSAVIREAR